MVWDQHFEKGSSNHCTKMKGKVLPWPLFVDTAQAPEHFTELTFSAAKRRRVNGRGLQRAVVRRRHRAVGEETPMLTQICPLYERLETSVRTNSTKRKPEHTHPYSRHLPKLLQKNSTFPLWPDTLLVQPWQICGHSSWKQSTWLKVSPDQQWRGTKTHWFPPLPSSTSHRHDFILRLLQRPEGMSLVLVNEHQEHSQQGQKYKAYLEHFCLCASICHSLD